MGQLLMDSTDLDEVESVLGTTFGRVSIHPTAGGPPPRMRLERSQVGAFCIDTAEYGFDFDYEAQPLGQILVCRVADGGLSERLPRQNTEFFKPGEVGAMGDNGAQPFQGEIRRGHYDQLVADPRVLTEAAGGSRADGAPVRLIGSRPVSAAANWQLFEAIELVKRSAASTALVQQNSLLESAMEQYVAALLLAAFPNTASVEPTGGNRNDSTPVLLRRATAFIDDNAHRDISVTDIAEAVFVTTRALQYMFRKHRGCTPMGYLRSVRMHHAHLDLIAGNHSFTTVTRIAQRWGFAHAGRFAVTYRETYGRSPHVTLRE